MNIYNLIKIIQEKEKLNDCRIIEALADAVSRNTDETELFRSLYIDAFGFNIIQEIAEDIIKEYGEQFPANITDEYFKKCGCNCLEISTAEFYLIMNVMFSEHNKTIQKHNISDPIIYAELASDWFRNAGPDKTFNFFFK